MIDGRTQKTTIDVGVTGVVYTVRPKFRGAPQNVTFSIVNGKQSYNNADFTINPATGELTLNVAFVSANKSKFVRVRMVTDDGAIAEKSIKFRSVVDKDPVVSGPQEYDSGVMAGDVIATLTSTFPDATFSIAGRESSGTTPAPPEIAEKAFTIVQTSPTTADVQWSGQVSPGEEYDFTIACANRDTGGCVTGEAEVDIPFMSVTPALPCGTPNADPTIMLTMSWTDPDVTKDFLGCTWNNGETKELYSTFYRLDISYFGSPGLDYQTWRRSPGAPLNDRMQFNGNNNPFPAVFGRLLIDGNDTAVDFFAYIARDYINNSYTIVSNQTLNGVTAINPSLSNIFRGVPINPNITGSLTTDDGLTLSWAPGAGW